MMNLSSSSYKSYSTNPTVSIKWMRKALRTKKNMNRFMMAHGRDA